jgi:hypothetical protein
LLAALAFGCGNKPRAPQIQKGDGPFHAASEGLRLQPPKGWRQFGYTELPGGRIAKEVDLVKYKLLDGRRIAVMRVSVVDLPEATSVDQFLRERPPSHEDWRPASAKTETVDVSGQPGVRLAFNGTWEGKNAVREVVAVRRGQRVYSFTCIFGSGDTKTRDAVRQAIASVTWEEKPNS